LGLLTAVGLLLVTLGLCGRDDPPPGVDDDSLLSRMARRGPVDRRRAALCLAVGVVVAVANRWPVAAALSAAAVWALPAIIGPDKEHAQRVARLEAIAVWTESLRDNLSAAAGLEQAITTSAIQAPEPIREEVTRLATRLLRSWRLSTALRALAAELADPTADKVVKGLLMAASGSAGQLGESLGEVAAAARAKVASRQRIAGSRKRNRTSVRVIVGATLAMAAVLTLINHGYLRPFDTPVGQLVLLVGTGGCFTLAFWGLAHLMRPRDEARVLAGVAEPIPTEQVVGS
jgi:Flp pilus assembly protein TadB